MLVFFFFRYYSTNGKMETVHTIFARDFCFFSSIFVVVVVVVVPLRPFCFCIVSTY